MKSSLDKVIAILNQVYFDSKEHLKYSENKNNILITMVGVTFIPLFTFFSNENLQKKILSNKVILTFLIITFLVGILIFLVFVISCFPKTNIKSKQKNFKKNVSFNIFFFKWWINDFEYCKKEILKHYKIEINNSNDSKIIESLIKQIYDYSFVINRKYFYSKIIIILFSSFIILFSIFVFLLLFF